MPRRIRPRSWSTRLFWIKTRRGDLGDINTRLKDHYDLWRISRTMEMDRDDLIEALRKTFQHRRVALPEEIPPGSADGFADLPRSRTWSAFIGRNGLDAGGVSFTDVVTELRNYCWPLIEAARRGG